MIYDDKAISSSDSDILERAAVAKKLAEAIAAYEDETSFVIGIQGKWGDGKTSFINMMLEKEKGSPLASEKFLIVNFNPWYFTGEDQILRQFLGLLSEKIAAIPDASGVIKEASKLIKRLSAVVKPLQPVLDIGGTFLGFPGAGWMADKILDKAGEFSQNLEEAFQPTEDVIQIKEEIGKALKKINYKILIVIDDIDRLNKKEIYDVFRLVKVIADFPNTIYFLSYDKRNVCSALSEYGHDERFIDKIVQHEFDIPRISEDKVSSFLDKVLLEIAGKHALEINEEDKRYYGHLVYSGLKYPVSNLREAKRILNKINFEYGCLKGEVNFFDLLGVTVLKLYAPKFYDFLLVEGARYVKPMGISTNEKDVYKKFKEEVGAEKSWAAPLLEALFPHVVSHPDMSAGAMGKHLYSEEHFNKYFQLAVVGGQISEFEYNHIINEAKEYTSFMGILQEYAGKNKIKSLLEGLTKRDGKFATEVICVAISALIDIADILSDEDREFLGNSSADKAYLLALKLFKNISLEKREGSFLEVVASSKSSMCYLIHFVHDVGQENGFVEVLNKKPVLNNGEKYLSEESFIKAQAVCIDRIDNANYEVLISSSGFPFMWRVLGIWDYKNISTVRAKLLGTKDGFLKMIRQYTGFVISTAGDYFRTRLDGIQEFMGEEISLESVLEKTERGIGLCSDQKLIAEVKEGLNNIED